MTYVFLSNKHSCVCPSYHFQYCHRVIQYLIKEYSEGCRLAGRPVLTPCCREESDLCWRLGVECWLEPSALWESGNSPLPQIDLQVLPGLDWSRLDNGV